MSNTGTVRPVYDRYWNNRIGFLECLKISWESSPWKQLSMINDEEKSSVSRMQRFMCSQILCYDVLERLIRTQHQILLGNDSWIGSKIHHNTELLDTIDGEPMEFEYFPRIHYIGARP